MASVITQAVKMYDLAMEQAGLTLFAYLVQIWTSCHDCVLFLLLFFDFCVYTCVLVELSRLKLVKGGGTKCTTQYVFGIRSFASYLFWCVYPVT